ncbi:MAG: S-layer homology domain-containing protein, partial [Actinomycetota bacterium]|nr:S-layer homology domain-containing protein [Actinomycetota bacterium]
VNPPEVTFSAQTWDLPQDVSITAVPDGMDEDDPHMAPISLSTNSADPFYNGILLADVLATIGDADALLVTIDGPIAGAPGQPATFAAVVNVGGSGTITHDWTAFRQGNAIATGDQSTFQFTPAGGGPYIIQAIVGDDQGQNPATFLQFTALSDIDGSGFADAIVWLTNQRVTRGCNPPDNTMFCPNALVTREQMAALLVRFLDLSDDGGGNSFTDDDGSIFEDDIAKLAAAGITSGCNPPDNTAFCPNGFVSRAEMAAFLVRALGLTDATEGSNFTDDDGSIFEDDIARLATAGITRGCNPPDNTQFCPTDFVTRGQMAALLRRANTILNP